ncbi:MAG: hypothetical protein RL757_3367 [Bacteroidota bacterium]|jgi:hypothetical protein
MGVYGDIFGGQWRQKWGYMETFLGVNGDKNGGQMETRKKKCLYLHPFLSPFHFFCFYLHRKRGNDYNLKRF